MTKQQHEDDGDGHRDDQREGGRPDGDDQRDQHLLGGVGRRRDDVRGQHGQGGRPAQALGRLPLRGERAGRAAVLQPVAEGLGEVDPDRPAAAGGRGAGRRPARGRSPRRARSRPVGSTGSTPPVTDGSTPSVNHGRRAGSGRHAGCRPGADGQAEPGAGAGVSCASARRCVLHGRVHVVIVGCGRVGSGLGIGLADAGPFRRHHRPQRQGLPPTPRRLAGDHRGRARDSTATTSTGPGPARRRRWPRSPAATTPTS